MKYSLRCVSCGARFSKTKSQICPKCGGLLEVEYERNAIVDHIKSFWDLEPVLPNGHYKHFVVGNTTLVESEKRDLLLKLETLNPTHSFKDRGSVIEVAKAKEYGYKEIVCASTGNMAYSISYFAKLYGIRSVIFISKGANKDKLIDIKMTHDSELHLINGDFTKAQKDAEQYAENNGAFLAGDYCYRKEGQSTIGFELFYQHGEINNIIMPIGNGTLFSAVYKAYSRIKNADAIEKLPRLIGVQASLCAPLAHATHGGIKYEKPRTKADAIAVGYPTYGTQVLDAIKHTSGALITVTDSEMVHWQKKFYASYGILAELAGVASMAAYARIASRLKGKTAVLITGANL
ncbi:MAG: pyridoxal-phosphate dependent enzyme [Candidatus Micrarchaeaceae archaeon]